MIKIYSTAYEGNNSTMLVIETDGESAIGNTSPALHSYGFLPPS